MAYRSTRREFLEKIVTILAAATLPSIAYAEDKVRPILKPRWNMEEEDMYSMIKLADAYKEKGPQSILEALTFLYPGSGTDTNVLEIGMRLLHQTPLKEARFILTEIGEYEVSDFHKANHWHEGYNSSIKQIEKGLRKNKSNVLKKKSRTVNTDIGWNNPAIPNSLVTEWDYAVPTKFGNKKLKLDFAYNTIFDREEPTEEEQKIFTSALLTKARGLYWPIEKKPGKIYPTYFLQSQFDQADVLISRQCGDLRLLQFDITRSFHRTAVNKPRVFVTESHDSNMTYNLDLLTASLPEYVVQKEIVEAGSNWGYCMMSNSKTCNLEMLTFSRA